MMVLHLCSHDSPSSLFKKTNNSFQKRTTAPLPWVFGLIPCHPNPCTAVPSCLISSHAMWYSVDLEHPPRNHVLRAWLSSPMRSWNHRWVGTGSWGGSWGSQPWCALEGDTWTLGLPSPPPRAALLPQHRCEATGPGHYRQKHRKQQ